MVVIVESRRDVDALILWLKCCCCCFQAACHSKEDECLMGSACLCKMQFPAPALPTVSESPASMAEPAQAPGVQHSTELPKGKAGVRRGAAALDGYEGKVRRQKGKGGWQEGKGRSQKERGLRCRALLLISECYMANRILGSSQ